MLTSSLVCSCAIVVPCVVPTITATTLARSYLSRPTSIANLNGATFLSNVEVNGRCCSLPPKTCTKLNQLRVVEVINGWSTAARAQVRRLTDSDSATTTAMCATANRFDPATVNLNLR